MTTVALTFNLSAATAAQCGLPAEAVTTPFLADSHQYEPSDYKSSQFKAKYRLEVLAFQINLSAKA